MYPEKIELLSDKVVQIIWDDGHESIYFADHLRLHCPCAECEKIRSEGESSFAFKEFKKNAETVTFKSWEMVGRYAIMFTFSDGHNLGMFQFEELRNLCQCDACRTDIIRIQGVRQG